MPGPEMLDKPIESDDMIFHAALVLKTIAHPVRLEILCLLAKDELCVHEITEAVGRSQSNVSQHLASLRSYGVLATRKDANRVLYHISDPRTNQIVSMLRDVFGSADSASHKPSVR
jgi:DNA-binding transcriptional ArsR family regulator